MLQSIELNAQPTWIQNAAQKFEAAHPCTYLAIACLPPVVAGAGTAVTGIILNWEISQIIGASICVFGGAALVGTVGLGICMCGARGINKRNGYQQI